MKEGYNFTISSIVKQNNNLGESTNKYTDYPTNEISIDKILKDKLTEEKYYKITIKIEEI